MKTSDPMGNILIRLNPSTVARPSAPVAEFILVLAIGALVGLSVRLLVRAVRAVREFLGTSLAVVLSAFSTTMLVGLLQKLFFQRAVVEFDASLS